MLAHAYHQAETSGSPVDGLEQPKSVGYGIGLAVGLFAMEFVGALFEYQSAQIAAVQGCCLRAAVSPDAALAGYTDSARLSTLSQGSQCTFCMAKDNSS
jgi:hypothetical protein